ncbi:cadherin domain-containing protein, partial [Roseibium sp. CAU 1637]
TANTVAENSAGGAVVGVTAFATDADAGDTVTYSITDARFEIDADTGVVTVADGVTLDAETTSSIDLEVTATSSDGSTSSATFTIAISDENEFAITPVSDTDGAANTITDTATAGTVVGITGFAEDLDVSDTVTYSIADGRFEIDATTGVVTVADGASFDSDAEPSVDLVVTATSTDGSSSNATFTIAVTDGGGNEAPDLIVDLPTGGQELLVNGSFETYSGSRTGSPGEGWYMNPDSIEGWDSYSNVDVHENGHNGYGGTDGGHHLDLASTTNGTISQTIEGQLDGHVYSLSFDMKSRGGIGESVAEAYWNGELIATIDPAETGGDWQTFNFDVVGGSGDGTNTLTFTEVGSDNLAGTLIDSVSIKSSATVDVAEEFAGAEITALSVVDPDVGDTHTFTLSDDRFEVVVDGDAYLLKLKDGEAFDYETETSVTVQVTATDSGGLSDTETVQINVVDVEEDQSPVGPVTDADITLNVIAETAVGGVAVGITAFASDGDPGDTVTYSIVDARFEIDADTGVITLADGVTLDADVTASIDLEVTATSSDGSSSSATFTVIVADDNQFSITPVTDVDVTANLVAETAVGGAVVGVTAFASDGDLGDTVT